MQIPKLELHVRLLARVQALEDQSGWLQAPAYDSGWVSITTGEVICMQHGLYTDELFVYLTGIDDGYGTVHQCSYGGRARTGDRDGVYWFGLNYTHIIIPRLSQDTTPQVHQQWDQIRVQIWKIQQP